MALLIFPTNQSHPGKFEFLVTVLRFLILTLSECHIVYPPDPSQDHRIPVL